MEDNSDYIDDFKPTAIFWDIENNNKKSHELQKFIVSIRSDLIDAKQLKEVEFTCVYVKGRLNDKKKSLLQENSINTIECVTEKPEVADLQLIKLIDDFVATYKCESIIILISCDGDFIKRLVKHKDDHNITIFTVHEHENSSYLLSAIGDENFTITNDGLVSITDRLNVCAVKVSGLPDTLDQDEFKSHLIEMFSYIGGSEEAIYFDCENHCYWINFECYEMARLVVTTKNGSKCLDVSLTLEYIKGPPKDVVKNLFQLDVDQSVRRKKLRTIHAAFEYERERTWEETKKEITSLKIKDEDRKKQNLFQCILVSGFPGNFDPDTIENFFEKHFNVKVEMFWGSKCEIAINRMDTFETIKIIEEVNRSKIHPDLKLRATLFYVLDYLPEIEKKKRFDEWFMHSLRNM